MVFSFYAKRNMIAFLAMLCSTVEEFSNIRGSLRGEKSVVVDDMTLWDQCFEIFKNGDFLYLFKS